MQLSAEEKQQNIFAFTAFTGICSSILLGIIFIIVLQISNIKQQNVELLNELKEVKELSIKNNQTLEMIKMNMKLQ